ncbi:hypothetical protein CP533_5989, partial [Ophiocordyceps camponoti-saundersi (nom. inval.)]
MVDSKCYEAWARENYERFPEDYETDRFDPELSNDAIYAYHAFRRLRKTNSKLMNSNLSIPSVHEQIPQWTKFGAPYYNIFKLDDMNDIEDGEEEEEEEADVVLDDDDDDDELAGDQIDIMNNSADTQFPFFQVLPSYFEDDAWWADEDKYGIEFNIHERDTIVIPTLHYDGNPKRTQVMLEIPIPRPEWNDTRRGVSGGARFKRYADASPSDIPSWREELKRKGIKYKLLWTNVCDEQQDGE